MRELRAWYRDRLPARIAALECARAGLGRQDPDALAAVRRIAHQLHGSGATYGFPEISEAAQAVEEAPAGTASGSLDRLLEILKRAADRALDEGSSILIVDDDVDLAHYLKALLGAPARQILVAHTGREAKEILDRQGVSLILLDLILPDMDGRNLLMHIRERLATAATPVVVVTVKGAGQARAECLALGADDYLEKPLSAQAVQAAVNARLEAGAETRHELGTDPATGLPNRAAFHEAFERARFQALATGAPLAVALVNLDHFGKASDAWGGRLGVQVLQRAAGEIQRSIQATDLVAYRGGEEFAVLFPGTDPSAAAQALRRALESLRHESFDPGDGRTVDLTFSAGVAAVGAGMGIEEAVAEADRNLYLAKQAGFGRVVTPGDRVEAPRRKFLLVEDDEMIRAVIGRLLEREGYEVTTCADGSAGLASAYENSYCMILSDVLMPQLDGFELLRRLREHPAADQTPIVMLTSMGQDQDVRRGFELGADDYIVKPFSATELLMRVRRLLKKAS